MARTDCAAGARAVVDPDFCSELFGKSARNRAGEDVAAAARREGNDKAGGFGIGKGIRGKRSTCGESHEKAGILNDLTTREHEDQLQ